MPSKPPPPPRRVAQVLITIDDCRGFGFTGTVSGVVADVETATRGMQRPLPEDVLKSTLERTERMLRQQLKENVR